MAKKITTIVDKELEKFLKAQKEALKKFKENQVKRKHQYYKDFVENFFTEAINNSTFRLKFESLLDEYTLTKLKECYATLYDSLDFHEIAPAEEQEQTQAETSVY